MAKRGHTNCYPEKCQEWHEIDKDVTPGIARIPIGGGASPQSYKEFPPLALRQEEWSEIGVRMGWMKKRKK